MIALYRRDLETRRLSERTVIQQCRTLETFQLWLLDAHGVDDWRDVRLDHVAAYAARLAAHRKPDGTPTSRGHQHGQLYTIKSFFRFLHATGRALVDPCADLPILRGGRALPRCVPDADQMQRLIEAPNVLHPFGFRDRCILELLFATGLRGKEVCTLTVHDLDLDGRFVRVRQGKGRKDRTVPLGKAATATLREYLSRVRPLFFRHHRGRAAVDRLFVTIQRTALRPSVLYYLIKRYARMTGLPSAVTTHSLRHACATEMLRGGASVRHVQEMLGHATIRTTQVYTRVLPSDLKAVHRRTAPSERRRAVRVPAHGQP